MSQGINARVLINGEELAVKRATVTTCEDPQEAFGVTAKGSFGQAVEFVASWDRAGEPVPIDELRASRTEWHGPPATFDARPDSAVVETLLSMAPAEEKKPSFMGSLFFAAAEVKRRKRNARRV